MFKFKGISSKDMKVIPEEEDVFLTRASRKYDIVDVQGRNGNIYNVNGYSDVEKSLSLQILDFSKKDEIFDWLSGSGILEYNEKITTAYFFSEIEPQRLASIKKADVTFIRSPFWIKNDEYQVVSNNVVNKGNVFSTPKIRLEKGESDIIDLTIANIRFKYTFNDEDYVEIDCENYYASYNDLNRNRNLEIGFEFPKIFPGENEIIIHEGDPVIKFKNEDRWL